MVRDHGTRRAATRYKQCWNCYGESLAAVNALSMDNSLEFGARARPEALDLPDPRRSAADASARLGKALALLALAAGVLGLVALRVGWPQPAAAAGGTWPRHTLICAIALAGALLARASAAERRSWLGGVARLLAAAVVVVGFAWAAASLVAVPAILVDEAAVNCMLLGFALLLHDGGRRPAVVTSQLLALGVLFSAQSVILEAILGGGWFDSLREFRRVPTSTAAVLALTAIGVLVRSSGGGLLGIVLADTPGARLVRTLLPAAVLVPLGFGWVAIYSRRAGWVDADLAETVLVMSTVLALVVLVAVVAARLHDAELARSEAVVALQESQEHYRLLAENGSDLVAVHDGGGRFTYVSPSCERILGFQREELLYTTPFSLVHPDDTERVQRHFRQLLGGDPATAIQCRMMHKSGRYVWLDIVWRPMHGANGEIVALQSWSRDITEAREYQQRLEEAERRLRREQEKLAQANRHLIELATTDALTGLRNRGAFEERLNDEVARTRRSGRPLSLLLLDIDRFKEYNDTFGHLRGDAVLRTLGSIVARTVREVDFAARYGGEEFAVILPDTERVGACELAERLRAAVEGADWQDREITISVGVAALGEGVRDAESLLNAADKALYRSKEEGRNRVSVARAG
jgi:diguanylate cyclase (GGDEF)-like protein/PAS domain S-box-containing protein